MASEAQANPTNVSSGRLPGRGEINVFYTGMPAYHPLAIAQGWDPAKVDQGIIAEVKELLKAGYNVLVVAAGPEIPMEKIGERMNAMGVPWHITGIGMGIRAAQDEKVIGLFEDLLGLFRKVAPDARQVFNNGPATVVWSVQKRIPLAEDSEERPGKLLGYECLFDGFKGEPLDWEQK